MKTVPFLRVSPWLVIALCIGQNSVQADGFVETDLVSDLPGQANNLDPNLVNPWGIAESTTSPFWISDNHSGVSTVYNGAGQTVHAPVTIPPPSGGTPPAAPTGIVFNGGSGFGGSHFIFDTEDGTVASWASGSSAVRQVDNSTSGAVYKGLALGNNGTEDLLYAANFHSGHVDVFNSSFASTTVSGGFTDPNLPAGYAPFGIRTIGSKLYVTFALQDSTAHDDVSGAGHGFVDVFDFNGVLQQRLISGGALNSPWGLAMAPAGFGKFGNDLLVGNFGDGRINVFDPSNGNLLGTLDNTLGQPIEIQGLWGLTFGNGAAGGSANDLYFTAGIPDGGQVEDHGLFGQIAFTTPDGGINTGCVLGGMLLGFLVWRRNWFPQTDTTRNG